MSRQERVKIERPNMKGVFAFFLLPQFWRSFGHFSHIKPTFIRTLALMLEQSGLLPINHPATRYSGIKGTNPSISGVMVEAWFHLRTRKNIGVYQWSMFGSIVMMFALFIGAIVMSVIYIFAGTMASAQLFNHPGGATDFAAVPVYGGGGSFDTADPGVVSPTGDLAIGLLDKVLRQGANGTGGVLQNAIAPMFGTYSTGVLVIASILVFWSIVSIVVDSARTGQFGGGRHNMVWTPIRFVFALGILVPIGGGFSSGQIIIMKLAEWGSNLGTNMWNTYVGGASTPDLLVTGLTASDPTDNLIVPYLEALYKMKSKNMAAEISHGGTAPAFNSGGYPVNPTPFIPPFESVYAGAMPHPEWIREKPSQVEFDSGDDTVSIYIGNAANPVEAGNIMVSNPNSRVLMGSTFLPGPMARPGTVAIPGAAAPDAMALFKIAARQAQITALNLVKPAMELFACAQAASQQPKPAAGYPLTCPNITILDPCNGGLAGGYGNDPADACIDKIVTDYQAEYNALVFDAGGAKDTILAPYISSQLVPESQADGWAGMGAWYYKIANINRGAVTSQKVAANVGKDIAYEKAKEECYWSLSDECQKKLLGDTISNKVKKAFNSIVNKGFVRTALESMRQGDGTLLVNIGAWGQTTHPIAQIAATGESIINKSLDMYTWIMTINMLAMIPRVGDVIQSLMAGPIGGLLGMFASFGLMPGIMLLYYVPLIPWIRVVFAVLAWIVSVVEAVVTLPIIALAHLRTDGEGLMGPMAQGAYVAWLNLLLRPGLTVIGFVMGGLIFEAMVLYANDTFSSSISAMGSGGFGILDQVLNTYLYVMVIYALVNASFKLVDIIPNATMGWLGGPGAQDFSGEAGIITQSMDSMGGEFAQGMGQSLGRSQGMGGVRGAIGGAVGGFIAKRQGRSMTSRMSSSSR